MSASRSRPAPPKEAVVAAPKESPPAEPTATRLAAPASESSITAPGPIGAWTNFWFAPADPIGLSALRILGGLLFLFWLLPFAGQIDALFGLNGWFDAQAYHEASHLSGIPPHLFSWSILYLCGTNSLLLTAVYWLSLAVLVLFTLGLWTRLTGLLTYVIVVSFTANPATVYDADTLLVMLAFYLMVGHLLLGWRRPGQSWAAPLRRSTGSHRMPVIYRMLQYLLHGLRQPGRSWAEHLLGPNETWIFRKRPSGGDVPAPSIAANLAVRLIQVHFAVVMLASGLLKLQVREWWAGVAPWFYLHPPLHTSLEDMQAIAPYADLYRTILSLTAYGAVAWQIAFPVFAWRRRWRPLLLGGAALAWLADAFFFGLPLLGPIMVVGCLSYLSPAEWRWTAALLGRLPGLQKLLPAEAAAAAPGAGRDVRKGKEASAVTVGHSR